MADEDKIAIVNARIACAMITMEGMKSDNALRIQNCESPAYGYDDFQRVITDHCIGENDVIGFLYHS